MSGTEPMPGKEVAASQIVDQPEKTDVEMTKTDDKNKELKKSNNKKNNSIDQQIENELNQIDNNLVALSNNFKKRRLSKNEMDFLESELNLDIDNITDADFDIHLQKLMNENDNTMVSAVTAAATEAAQQKEDAETNALFVDDESDDESNAKLSESAKSAATVVKAEEGLLDDPKEKKETKTNTDKENNDDVDVDMNSDEEKTGISTTVTDTYKGVSIPSNSELFNTNETDSVLQAYRDLVNDSNRSKMKESAHINAQLSALPLLLTAPDHLSFNVQMLINTLPVLDNLSTQILRIIAKGPYQKVMELVSNRESYTGIAFGNLVELFETTKRVYNSEESPFFTVENVTFGLWKYGQQAPVFLRGREDTIEGTLRKVNLSTFLLATLGLIDLGFFFLNEAFLDVFCPPQNLEPSSSLAFVKDKKFLDAWPKDTKTAKIQRNQTKFLKGQAILYLELKTQAYISAVELGDRSKEDIIHDLFPDNMDEILVRRKDPYFDSSAVKVERNSALFTPAELDFLSRCDFRKQTLLNSEADSTLMEKYEWIKFLNDLLEYVSKNVGFLIWGPKGKLSSELDRLDSMTQNNEEQPEEKIENSESEEEEITKKRKAEDGKDSTETNTESKAVRAKSKSPPPTPSPVIKRQRVNRPSTFRRVWTTEEEDTLKEGLLQKGTHWTAILELYGPGGTVNENLKNRSSLQLKDKARNWKLYYIKNKLPVPPYLLKGGIVDTVKKSKPKKVTAAEVNAHHMMEADKPSEFDTNDAEVYNQMFDGLLPDVKGDGKLSGEHEEVVASELKDLVAEAFK